MKKLLFIIAVLATLASCQEKKQERFEREAREFTEKNCPQQLDAITTIDSMVYVNEGTGELRIYYTLQLNDEERELFMDKLTELGENNLKIVRNSVLFVKYKDEGIKFSYIYHDAVTGEKLVEYNFSEEEYK